MAQSALKDRALLGIEPFWERPSLEPLLRRERWRIILKLAILVKEVISIDKKREAPPSKVTFPLEPTYEEHLDNSKTQSDRYSRIRNEKLKNAWLNKCQKIEAAGILCGDRSWKFCDIKAVSLTYLSLGTDGCRIFGSHEPTIQIDQI